MQHSIDELFRYIAPHEEALVMWHTWENVISWYVSKHLKPTKTNDTKEFQHWIWSWLSIDQTAFEITIYSYTLYKRRGDVYRFGVRERPPLPSTPPTHFITSSENYYSHLVLMGWLLLEKLLWNKSPLIQDEGGYFDVIYHDVLDYSREFTRLLGNKVDV